MHANNTPTLIVTRPDQQGDNFAADVVARWGAPVRIVKSPLLKIVPVSVAPVKPDAVIFTSTNAVVCAGTLNLLRGMTAWCVGKKTAKAAKEAGFAPIIGPGDAEGLTHDIVSAAPTGRLAHVRGRHARGDICRQLNAAGLSCTDVIVYDQVPLALSIQAQHLLAATEPLIFPLFSPRTAAILSKQGPFAAPIHIVALSDAVQSAVQLQGEMHMSVAVRPDATAMMGATLAVLTALAQAG